MTETVKLPGGEFMLTMNPRQLPELRRVEYECYRLLESGIGSDMGDIDRHFDTMVALCNGRKYEDLTDAINNLRYLFFGMLHKQITPRSLALGCLVQSINGQPVTDYSESGLERIVEQLSALGLTDELINDLFEQSKKKSIPN